MRYPQVVIHSLSPSEIHYIARRSKLSIRDTMLRLKDAGWESFPAVERRHLLEVLVQTARHQVPKRPAHPLSQERG